MRRLRTVTALSVSGVAIAAIAAATINTQILGAATEENGVTSDSLQAAGALAAPSSPQSQPSKPTPRERQTAERPSVAVEVVSAPRSQAVPGSQQQAEQEPKSQVQSLDEDSLEIPDTTPIVSEESAAPSAASMSTPDEETVSSGEPSPAVSTAPTASTDAAEPTDTAEPTDAAEPTPSESAVPTASPANPDPSASATSAPSPTASATPTTQAPSPSASDTPTEQSEPTQAPELDESPMPTASSTPSAIWTWLIN